MERYRFVDRARNRIKTGDYINEFNTLFRIRGFLNPQTDELESTQTQGSTLVYAESDVNGIHSIFWLTERDVQHFRRMKD